MSLILGIESTCDETAAAVVRDGVEVLSNAVATQFDLHAKFRGVVPEIASRAHIENLLPVISEALNAAGVGLREVDAIAAAHRPGLIGSLLIGVTAAKSLAWALKKPLLAVDHVQAHLYSVILRHTAAGRGDQPPGAGNEPPMPDWPAVGMVISGGHTALYRIRGWLDIGLLGATMDDAVGEAYDKVAAMLGLPFPGGPEIDRLADAGDPGALDLPRPLLEPDSLDFSFSGLKTAVRYRVFGYQGRERSVADLSPGEIAGIAASFQTACIDTLLEKVRRAVRRFQARSVIIGGGVSANRGLRRAISTLPVRVYIPEPSFCTDNAAMIAGLGHVLWSAGREASLDLDAITQSEVRRVAS
ncbi:MAG: tRNA (adenosine(37)-N6)-threonylcarbamoyltransferase complex transferase subunit TsaD [Phycisphaerae bacterium]|nr:tRNA (adenosine(37)-N6)-threonylcarbamoyltransferase complex transferase subunit TsaD [Phycisphaerae bacterium]